MKKEKFGNQWSTESYLKGLQNFEYKTFVFIKNKTKNLSWKCERQNESII